MSSTSNLHLKVEDLKLSTKLDFELRIDSLEVFKGENVAVVGANGSGKTTLIEGLLGLRETSSGAITMLGTSYRAYINNEVKNSRLGVQLQNVSYPDNYKVKEIVELHSVAYGKCSDDVYKLLDIESLANKKYVKVSRGQKQRIDLYVAFAHDPDLLILDEPSTGLDETFRKSFSNLMDTRFEDPTKTTIVVTHTGHELCRCNKIVWIQDGKILRTLEVDQEIKRGVIEDKLLISFTCDKGSMTEKLNGLSGISFIGEDGFNSVVAFGADLADAKAEVEKLDEVLAVQHAKTIGTEFLKFVANESVEAI